MEIEMITGTTMLTATTYTITAPNGEVLAYSQCLTTGDVIVGVLLLAVFIVTFRQQIISSIRGR